MISRKWRKFCTMWKFVDFLMGHLCRLQQQAMRAMWPPATNNGKSYVSAILEDLWCLHPSLGSVNGSLEKVGGISLSDHLLSETMGNSQLRWTNGKILLEILCISMVETRAFHNVHSMNCIRLLLEQPFNTETSTISRWAQLCHLMGNTNMVSRWILLTTSQTVQDRWSSWFI